MVLDKETFRRIEWCLYHYFELRNYIKDMQDDIYYAGPVEKGIFEGKKSQYSDPTAEKAIKADKCLGKERILVKVIEKVKNHYTNTDKGKLLQKKYFDELGTGQVMKEIHIEKSTYFEWRTEIVNYAAFIAQKYGILDIENPEVFKNFLHGIMQNGYS